MKLLLDTHIWIWALDRPERLSRTVRRHLENSGNELYLSPISIWEAHHLERLGRVRGKQSIGDWVDKALGAMPLLEAPFNFAVAAEASRIELPQNDIGDIFLAATASVFSLTLITSDTQLLQCRWLKTLSND